MKQPTERNLTPPNNDEIKRISEDNSKNIQNNNNYSTERLSTERLSTERLANEYSRPYYSNDYHYSNQRDQQPSSYRTQYSYDRPKTNWDNEIHEIINEYKEPM